MIKYYCIFLFRMFRRCDFITWTCYKSFWLLHGIGSKLVHDIYIYKYWLINNFVNIEFQVLKICANWSGPLKIVWYELPEFKNVSEIFLKNNSKSSVILFCDDPGSENKNWVWLTRWCQIKFIYSFLMFLSMIQWSSGMITIYDSADLGSDPDGVKILIFQIPIPWRFWDVLGYIDTHLGWKYIAHMV